MNTLIKYRLFALAIDLVIALTFSFALSIIHIAFFETIVKYDYRIGLSLFLSFFICKDSVLGQSIGKRIYTLKVVDYESRNLTSIKLIIRNLFVFLAPIELLLIIYYDKRIGDSFVKSNVVKAVKTEKVSVNSIFTYLISLVFTYTIIILLI